MYFVSNEVIYEIEDDQNFISGNILKYCLVSTLEWKNVFCHPTYMLQVGTYFFNLVARNSKTTGKIPAVNATVTRKFKSRNAAKQ